MVKSFYDPKIKERGIQKGKEEVYYSDIGTVENIEKASIIELRDSKVENMDFNFFSINLIL
ncbi:hypothetical protein [Oceanirhabdus seepicola]|uniref:Uncharacterized protein n=1 Tax=Oceanirhabdus seepicola TaxID=2828781 RepID=A0A9J6P5K1_9CLOT|nr:hypothetical protein [Oceanirhabdus seepicola]MCM1991401.1 hypothetical protein [Oceanirhabdus seepicola]